MSDIVLGEMARINFGFRKKYEDSLIQEYKNYIDNLEKDIIAAIYGNDIDNCLINRTYEFVYTENDTNGYYSLESSLIFFCRLHNIFLKILRYDNHLEITIDLLLPHMLTYE